MSAPPKDFDGCVLVATCRRYEYILDAFFRLKERYWADCALPVYLASDGDLDSYRQRYGVHVLARQQDPGFLEGWLHALQRIEHRSVLLLQEDFLIERPVDGLAVDRCFALLRERDDVASIRLMPFPPPRGPRCRLGGLDLFEILPDSPYAFSWQATIWRRDRLVRFLEHRLARGDERLAALCGLDPASAGAVARPRAPKPRPDPFAFYNPEHHGREMFDLFPGERFLGFGARSADSTAAALACPLPYRPTAIVDGELRFWAAKLLEREGLKVEARKVEPRARAMRRAVARRSVALLQRIRRRFRPRATDP